MCRQPIELIASLGEAKPLGGKFVVTPTLPLPTDDEKESER